MTIHKLGRKIKAASGEVTAVFFGTLTDKEFEPIARHGLPEGWTAWHVEETEIDPPSERVLAIRSMPHYADGVSWKEIWQQDTGRPVPALCVSCRTNLRVKGTECQGCLDWRNKQNDALERGEKLREARTQLTLIFAGGRVPSDDEMPRVDELRGEITRLENEIRAVACQGEPRLRAGTAVRWHGEDWVVVEWQPNNGPGAYWLTNDNADSGVAAPGEVTAR